MSDASNRIARKLRSYGNVLRDDGLSYADHLEPPTYDRALAAAVTGGRSR